MQKPQIKQWTNQSNLSQAQRLKQIGNKFFIQKQYKNALRQYHKCILHLNGIIDKSSSMSMYTKVATQQISQKSNLLKYNIWLNMCQIYIYQTKYQKGLEILRKAQQMIQKNVELQLKIKKNKLYYRKGLCYMKLNYFQQARQQFRKLKQIDNTFDKQIEQYQSEIKSRQKASNIKTKQMYQGFFK